MGIELLLHPGAGKCGSSSIQADVYGRRRALEGLGVYIPDGDMRFSFEPPPPPSARFESKLYPLDYFTELLDGGMALGQFERRLDEAMARAAEAPGRERWLISVENLADFYRPHARDLHRLIASRFDRVRVVYYMRRQDDWLLSSWQQWGHKGGEPFDRWLEWRLENKHPQFLRNATALEEVYGGENVSVIPLHRSAFAEGDLLSDFYRRFGLEVAGDHRDDSMQNQAVNPYLCDILARIPTVFNSVHDTEVRYLLERHVASTELFLRRHREFVGDATRKRILDHFADDNRELHRRYFGELDFDELFAHRPSGRDEAQVDRQIEGLKEVLAIQTDLLIQLLKRDEAQARRLEALIRRPSLAGRLKRRVSAILRPRGG